MSEAMQPPMQPPMPLVFSTARRIHLQSGEVLFREADRSTKVYQCITGTLRLVAAAAHGRELILDVVLAGEVFGELSAIDGQGRRCSAIAAEVTSLAVVEGDVYLEAMANDPQLSVDTFRRLARLLRRADQRICDGETERLSVRAARLLMELSDRFEARHPARAGHIPITQSDLADLLGASREATARVLAELRSAGTIGTGRSLITIADRVALGSVASM
jgi:CRP/FNR family transcriptional regulator, cyclic AMP receptor protein